MTSCTISIKGWLSSRDTAEVDRIDDEHHVDFADAHRCVDLVLFCCFGERFEGMEVNR